MVRWIAKRLLESLCAQDLQDWTENFVLITFHVGLHMVNQRWREEKTVLKTLQGEAATIDNQFGAFINRHLDITFDPGLVSSTDYRAVVGFGIG